MHIQDIMIHFVHRIDQTGLFVEDLFWLDDDGPIPADCITVHVPQGFIRARWDGAQWVEGGTPPAPRIPVSVSARQARLALEDAGLLDTINTAFNGKAKKARIEWEFATEIRRDSPLVASMATELGLTPEQLDQLFLAADAL